MNDIVLPETEKPSLAIHEWLAITAVLCFMATLTGVSIYFTQDISNIKTGSPHHLKPQEIEVKVEGAVENPGIIKLKPGATRQQALELAKPLPTADLRKLKGAIKVRNGQVITVPAKEMIEITVTGAVENPGIITIPKGTRLQDLSNFIVLTPDANSPKLQKKRILKNGETISIPKKR